MITMAKVAEYVMFPADFAWIYRVFEESGGETNEDY